MRGWHSTKKQKTKSGGCLVNSKLLNEVLLPGVDIEVTITARLLWREPCENRDTLEGLRRQEASNLVNSFGQNMQKPVEEILSQMIYQRAQIDG